MKNFQYFAIIAIAFLIGCNVDGQKTINKESIEFITTDESKIYFKNVRQSDYDIDEVEAAGINIFRISERTKEADYPLINLVIAHNWRIDRAYLFIEPTMAMSKEGQLIDSITLLAKNGNDLADTLTFTANNITIQSHFIADIYNSMVKGKSLVWLDGDREVPMFDKIEDKEAFRKTCFDYYKLTGVIK